MEITLDEFPSPADLWARYRAWKGLTPEAEQIVLQEYFEDGSGKAAALRPDQRSQPGRRGHCQGAGTGKTYAAFQIMWRLWKAGSCPAVDMAERVVTNAAFELVAPPHAGDIQVKNGIVTRSMSNTAPADLIPAQRHARILELLRRIGGGAVNELSEKLGVSTSTIRRDLEHLTTLGYLERTHGGAVIARSQHTTFEPESAVAAQTSLREKVAIGTEAVRRIEPRQCVILDTGSTVLQAARLLSADDRPLTAVTNNIAAALLFSNCRSVRTVVTGGSLLPDSTTLWGEPGEGFLAGVHADICLLGAHAVTGLQITETSLEGAAMKRAMIRASRQCLLLVDSSKFQPAAFSLVATLDQISEVITDEGIAPETLAELRAAGVVVTVVKLPRDEP